MLKRATEKRIFDFDKRAVAFWMEVEGTSTGQALCASL